MDTINSSPHANLPCNRLKFVPSSVWRYSVSVHNTHYCHWCKMSTTTSLQTTYTTKDLNSVIQKDQIPESNSGKHTQIIRPKQQNWRREYARGRGDVSDHGRRFQAQTANLRRYISLELTLVTTEPQNLNTTTTTVQWAINQQYLHGC